MKFSAQSETGLTLIEVLIALAILSIALTAIIQSASQNIKNTLYLQNRTIATWIGTDTINNIRAGIIKLPDEPDHVTKEDHTLGQNWLTEATLKATPNPHIKQIIVDVYHQPDTKKFAHLESYIYVG